MKKRFWLVVAIFVFAAGMGWSEDIDSTAQKVMNQSGQSSNKDLKDSMAEMKKKNAEKKAKRELAESKKKAASGKKKILFKSKAYSVSVHPQSGPASLK